MILNLVFLVHAALAAVFALSLLFCLEAFTRLALGVEFPTGPAADLVTLYARFAALGAVAVVLAIGFAVPSGRHTVRKVALLALLALSALVALVFAIAATPFTPLRFAMIALHAALAVAYLAIWVFRPRDV